MIRTSWSRTIPCSISRFYVQSSTSPRVNPRIRAMSSAANEAAPLTKRAVAGSFLFKLTSDSSGEEKAQVALFRRSDEVRTYQNRLAPLSGSIEPEDATPQATALREIHEETGLPASALELLCRGKPYAFVDDGIGREWTINPFAFRLKAASEPGGVGEEGIKLDWEHKGYGWFDPITVNASDEFGGVPRLVDSLRRVWPAYDLGPKAGEILNRGLQRLRDDHEHGAAILANMALETFKDVVETILVPESQDSRETQWANVRMVAWHICQARPSMGSAITSTLLKALNSVESVLFPTESFQSRPSPTPPLQNVRIELNELLKNREHAKNFLQKSFCEYIEKSLPRKKSISILTLSNSSAVSSCLTYITLQSGIDMDIRILESRPLCEGVTLASQLRSQAINSSASINITIYSDAAAAQAAEGVDLVVLGADRVSSAGDISNKIGSLPAVLTARHVSPATKIVILSDTDKIAGPGSMQEHKSEENDASELSQAWEGVARGAEALGTDRVVVKNPYFDWVPADLIDVYVTEQGIWTADKIKEQSAWIGKETDRFFGDL
ncbi:translation initiation factor eIF-2B subunit family protein [Xylariaceae sp. FL0255]|nr:translation initiation factor eIF-2B subunit family protein [Xylariaceae sp. FL0255]